LGFTIFNHFGFRIGCGLFAAAGALGIKSASVRPSFGKVEKAAARLKALAVLAGNTLRQCSIAAFDRDSHGFFSQIL